MWKRVLVAAAICMFVSAAVADDDVLQKYRAETFCEYNGVDHEIMH